MSARLGLYWQEPAPGGPVGLSDGQRWLLATVRRLGHGHGGQCTLTALSRVTGASSPAVTSRQLARLRSLGLVGYRSTRGRSGYVRWWFGPRLRRGVATRAYRPRAASEGNVVGHPFGDTHTRGATASGRPLAAGGAANAARGGPRRGRRPPLYRFGRCPAGHPVKPRRWGPDLGHLVRGPDGPERVAEYRGECRRCGGVPVVEIVTLAGPIATVERRQLSPAELEAPELRAGRELRAARLVAAGLDGPAVDRIVRDYGRHDGDTP